MKKQTPMGFALRMTLGAGGTLALFFGGCAMCCGPYDYHYPNFGGSVQRSDPVWGRVGSLYSDPGPFFGGPSADSNLKPHEGDPASSESLEDINGNSPKLDPPDKRRKFDEMSDPENSDILPPPNLERPGPDEDTRSLRRLRNQSRNQGRQQWR